MEPVLDKLPVGFIELPWFQLKMMINKQLEDDSMIRIGNNEKSKLKKQDKKFLNEISKEKDYLEV